MSKNTGYEMTGKVIKLDEIQTFASGFTKQEFVVEDNDDKYPQQIKFECVKERADQLAKVSVGDPVEVSFNIRGNEYNGKYYVNLQAWLVRNLANQDGAVPPAPAQDAHNEAKANAYAPDPTADALDEDEEEKIPF